MKKRLFSAPLLVAYLILSGFGATYKGCVFNPLQKDFLTTEANVQVQGNISEFDDAGKFKKTHTGQVRLKKNGAYISDWQDTVNNSWDYPSVMLSNGVNILSGDVRFQNESGTWVNATIPSMLIEKKSDLPSRGIQNVFFDWSDARIAGLIKEIGTATLDRTFTEAEKNQFVTDVKNKVIWFFNTTYKGTNVKLVNAAGTDVHTVKFDGADRCDYYGESPGDYKNQNKQQTSHMYVGTFHCIIVDDNRLVDGTAAVKTDTVEQRVTDVGIFIGRTVTHELGHSLGLSDEANLHGCEGMHNCESYDNSNPSDRFDNGHFTMDPGPKSTIWARIGQESSTVRKTQLPKFNSYNSSYLKTIHEL